MLEVPDRLAALERRWAEHDIERPDGLVPARPDDLAMLTTWLTPLELPTELRQLFAWFGGSGRVSLLAGGSHHHGDLIDPLTGVEEFLDFYATTLGSPFPRNLVPILAIDRSLAMAEITPQHGHCRVWHYEIEGGTLELFYPTIADLLATATDLIPRTEKMAEDGDDPLAPHIAAARHRDLFDLADGEPVGLSPRPRTTCDRASQHPTGPMGQLCVPWPDHWIPGGPPHPPS